MDEIFQVPGTISQVKSMVHSWRISIDTQENIPNNEMSRILDMMYKLGWFTFNIHQKIQPGDIVDLPPLKKTEDSKSPAQRLRAILYLLWKRDNDGIDTFEVYYASKMEKFINHFKEKLN